MNPKTLDEERWRDRGRREGARRMAIELARIFGGPHDHKNGNPKFIMAMEGCAETCLDYAEMDDPLQWLEDIKNDG